MIETDRLKVHSKILVSELKAFVASGSSYKAKPGETDDLVSACLLSMRIMAVLKDWDPGCMKHLIAADTEDDMTPCLAYSANVR